VNKMRLRVAPALATEAPAAWGRNQGRSSENGARYVAAAACSAIRRWRAQLHLGAGTGARGGARARRGLPRRIVGSAGLACGYEWRARTTRLADLEVVPLQVCLDPLLGSCPSRAPCLGRRWRTILPGRGSMAGATCARVGVGTFAQLRSFAAGYFVGVAVAQLLAVHRVDPFASLQVGWGIKDW
jgi:hypothetical protein